MTTSNFTKFEIGKRYGMNSACDSDCWWYYTVTARTASTVTLMSDRGEVKKCRISKIDSEFFNAETVSPLGKYSMSPCLIANRNIQEDEPKEEAPAKPKAMIISLSDYDKIMASNF